jgi:large subunit ribosomal protein L29
MKQSEIIELSVEDLKAKLVSLKKELSDMKLGHSVTPLENPLVLRSTRRSIARISTELSKRELQ